MTTTAPTTTTTTVPLAVEMRGITKAFNGVPVLREVSFDLRPGEVHALVGENGAGKSTLMKILQGVYSLDSGEILVGGKVVHLSDTFSARAAGIGMVFQEFSLVPTLSVAQNMFLTTEPLRGAFIDDRRAEARAVEVFREIGVDLDPRAEVGKLGTAYWQLTEIGKALAQNARVLIMDEPTASLAKHEAEALFELIGRLKTRGVSIIYISHRMDEIYRIADRITALRDGRKVLTERLAHVDQAQIVQAIVGHVMDGQLTWRERAAIADAAPVLEAKNLTSGTRVRDVSFTLHEGEIIGLAGLMGSGRTELVRTLFGIDKAESGSIEIRGRAVSIRNPQEAIAEGLALIPEDRRAQGVVLQHSVSSNLLLPLLDRVRTGALISTSKSTSMTKSLMQRFSVKASSPSIAVGKLSGGNQQKVVIAKWLGTEPKILMMDEPTAGVDIGTKSEILEMVRSIADEGKGVIFISSELPELLAVSDRILVLRDGEIVKDLRRSEVTTEESLQLEIQGA
jgi:ribose transport system ATP-binding protein